MLRATILIVLVLGAVMAETPSSAPYMKGEPDAPLDAQNLGPYVLSVLNVEKNKCPIFVSRCNCNNMRRHAARCNNLDTRSRLCQLLPSRFVVSVLDAFCV